MQIALQRRSLWMKPRTQSDLIKKECPNPSTEQATVSPAAFSTAPFSWVLIVPFFVGQEYHLSSSSSHWECNFSVLSTSMICRTCFILWCHLVQTRKRHFTPKKTEASKEGVGRRKKPTYNSWQLIIFMSLLKNREAKREEPIQQT